MITVTVCATLQNIPERQMAAISWYVVVFGD
jgi:hypothetical protein